MKVKLLKKIRKRFEILYYPNGLIYGNIYDSKNETFVLTDTENEYNIFFDQNKNSLLETILLICKRNYYSYSRRYKLKGTKVWYKS